MAKKTEPLVNIVEPEDTTEAGAAGPHLAAASSSTPDEATTKPEGGSAPDPFDLASLRLDQSFVETAGVKKLLTTVPVGKPSPQDFIRVHPGPNYRDTFAMIELKEDREFYVLQREIARALPGEFVMATLFTCVNRQGVIRLFPVRLPGGKVNVW